MNRKEIIEAAKRRKKSNIPHNGNWALDTDWQKYIMDIIRMEDSRASNTFSAAFRFLKERAAGVFYSTLLENQYVSGNHYNLAFKYIINNCYKENGVIDMVMENE